MEKELFFTGYCRVLDASRTVEVIKEDDRITEVDCRFGNCLYESNCPIAKNIKEA